MTRDKLVQAVANGEVLVLGHLAGILMTLQQPAPEPRKQGYGSGPPTRVSLP